MVNCRPVSGLHRGAGFFKRGGSIPDGAAGDGSAPRNTGRPGFRLAAPSDTHRALLFRYFTFSEANEASGAP